MKRIRNFLIPLLLFFSYLSPIFSNTLKAEDLSDSLPIRINEFMPNPKSYDNDYEWIEIYNFSQEEFDLTGCSIDNYIIEKEIVIQADEYIVFTRDLLDTDEDGRSFEERYGNNSALWGDEEEENYRAFEASFSLSNSQGEVLLNCAQGSDIITWEDSSEAQSFSISENGDVVDNYLVTPGKKNIDQINITYPDSILITEIYPSPDKTKGEQEWLEIFNFGNESIDLTGWYITDTASKQNFPDDLMLKANEYFVLKGNDLDITLNNSGDDITLFNPNDIQVVSFQYENTRSCISNILKFDDGHYQEGIYQSQVATPNQKNKFISPNNMFYGKQITLISEAKDILEEVVVIEGVIIAEIDQLGSKQFYVQDKSGGINVYFSDKSLWKSYQLGDKLRLVGEIKYSREEPKIYIQSSDAVRKISKDNNFKFHKQDTGSIKKSDIGKFLLVSGEIINTSGKTFYIDDGSGEIKILIKNSTQIETPEKESGQFAQVKGVLSVYGTDGDGNLAYRLLPRYAEDILISEEPINKGEVLAVTGENIFIKIYVAFLLLLSFIFRLRIKSVSNLIFSLAK